SSAEENSKQRHTYTGRIGEPPCGSYASAAYLDTAVLELESGCKGCSRALLTRYLEVHLNGLHGSEVVLHLPERGDISHRFVPGLAGVGAETRIGPSTTHVEDSWR